MKTADSKHPDDAEWMLWLYNESDVEQSAFLNSHYAECDHCRCRVDRWKTTLAKLSSPAELPLDSTDVTIPTWMETSAGHSSKSIAVVPRRSVSSTQLAIAALVVVLAFFTGRSFSTQPDLEQLRTELKSELQSQLKQELNLSIQSEIRQLRTGETDLVPLIQSESGRVVSATLSNWVQKNSEHEKQLESVLTGILDNQVNLRRDLETLAIEAEAQILKTRRELLRLSAAGNSDPAQLLDGGATDVLPGNSNGREKEF
ncbi:MAG: hypothetical protein JNL58_28145 [Planctomyces sp.]|nr:hypothetical protein [Planctomyces sp.]